MRSYLVLLRVRCRPFHPAFADSSLLPSLTLPWTVITCYASLWSSEVPLVNIAFTSDDFPIHTLSRFISFSFLYKLVLSRRIELRSFALQTNTMTTLVQIAILLYKIG